ncbi:MAG: PKD domain-containing protein [Bacteroidetes bacterium]|nr:MAG: PKD domain-containing protein [Bacteroidota bacterium]
MKRLLLLCLFSLFLLGTAKAQYLSVSVSFADTFNVAPNFTVNASIRNSDSTANPNALSLTGSYASGGYRVDSFVVSSGYTGNQITVNYQDCGIWKTYTTSYTGNYVNINITLHCSPQCNAAFNHYDTALTSSFYPVSYHQSLQHTWFYGDGDSSNTIAINHTYAQPGVYLAQHRVRAANGHCEETLTDTVRVSYPCNSQFSLQSNLRDIQLQSAQNHAYLSHVWTFGDGQTSTSVNPTHTYTQDGVYGISHTVTDNITNCTITSYDTAYINTNCDAYFGVRDILPTSASAYCKDSSSILSALPTTYTWDFGDNTTGSGSSINHTFQWPDSFTIKLKIKNGSCIDSFSRTVGVGLDCTTPVPNYNTFVSDSLRYVFSFQGFRPFHTYLWYIEDSIRPGPTAYHIFSHTGAKTAKLVWNNGNGCHDSLVVNFSAMLDTQVYILSHSVTPATAGTGMYTLKQTSKGYKYQQYMVVDQTDTLISLNSGPYWFTTPGWHYVNYHAYNNFTSASAVDSIFITDTSQCKLVLNRTPYADSNFIQYSLNGTVLNYLSGQNRAIYTWDLDGGTFQSLGFGNPHIFFKDSGNYTIRLTMTDSSGLCVNQKDSIQVYVPRNSPCTANFSSNYITPNKLTFTADFQSLPSSSYRWTFDNAGFYSGASQTRTFNTHGSHLVTLTINSTTCKDSSAQWVTSYPPCGSETFHQLGSFAFQFVAPPAVINQQAMKWYISHGNTVDSVQGDSLTYVFPESGNFTVNSVRLDNNGNPVCTGSRNFQISHCGRVASNDYFVYLQFNGQVLNDYDSIRIYFITVDSTNWTIGSNDSITLYSGVDSGIWVDFSCLPSTGYTMIKGALLPGSKYYSDYLPTYMTNSTQWTGGHKISSNFYANQHHIWTYGGFTLDMVLGTNPGGPGFIGGYISQGANKNGAGLDGIQVNLFDTQDKPVAVTYTFNAGRYEFKDLAYGTYKVSVDIPGKSTATYFVTLNSSNESSDELNFEVNTQSIDLKTLSVQLPASSFRIYPNPVKDKLYVESNGANPVINAEVRDLNGKIISVTTENNFNSLELYLGELPKGVYFLYVYSDQAFTVYKITKSE